MRKVALEELTPVQQELVTQAIKVKQQAYAPYSKYKVGAALRDEKNAIHTGCNIEGADYTLTTHAEMGAINAMVKSGTIRLLEIAIAVESEIGHGMPCGLCRQKIREFAGEKEVPVLGINLDPENRIRAIHLSNLEELLPYSFGPEFL